MIWYKPEEDAPPVIFRTEAAVPKGWIRVPGHYDFMLGQWIDDDPLDHDGNGKRGGSLPDDRTPLRAAYFEKFGKKPYMGWDAATLREKLG